MPDVAAKATDEILARTERRLDKVYRQAAREAKQKYLAYIQKYQKELAVKQAELAAGKITEKQYQDWVQRKMFSGKKYQEMARTLADDLAKVDYKAMSIVNGFLPEAYAVNYNFMAFELDKAGVPLGASFTLYDRHTVEKLIREKKALLPKPRVDIPKDQRWNAVHIKNAITQGVLQGESIPNIAKRLEKVVGMDKTAAVRNARTAMTGAQNGGRVDRMLQSRKKGIEVWKEWSCAHDGRTRDSHLSINGERVPPDEAFSNGCMCPGDPKGEPSEVYNCRCTIIPWLPDYDFDADAESLSQEEFDKWIDERYSQEETFEDRIKRLQDEVAQNNTGVPTEAQLKEAGEAMAKEYDKFVADARIKLENEIAQAEADLKVFDKEILRLDREISAAREVWNDALVAELQSEQAYIMDMRFQTVLKHTRLTNAGVEITQKESVDWLTNQLSKVREVGTKGLDIAGHLNNSRSPMRPIVEEAYSHYPKSWVERSLARGRLTPKKVGRGYYDDYGREIAISFRNANQAQGTAIHELGHRFERAVPGIRDAEQMFYERRTAGEMLQWLGQGYDRSEVTRFDKFVNAYMGKDYGGDAYELVSMGFQYAYTDPARLAQDPDMQSWIYGLLCLMP